MGVRPARPGGARVLRTPVGDGRRRGVLRGGVRGRRGPARHGSAPGSGARPGSRTRACAGRVASEFGPPADPPAGARGRPGPGRGAGAGRGRARGGARHNDRRPHAGPADRPPTGPRVADVVARHARRGGGPARPGGGPGRPDRRGAVGPRTAARRRSAGPCATRGRRPPRGAARGHRGPAARRPRPASRAGRRGHLPYPGGVARRVRSHRPDASDGGQRLQPLAGADPADRPAGSRPARRARRPGAAAGPPATRDGCARGRAHRGLRRRVPAGPERAAGGRLRTDHPAGHRHGPPRQPAARAVRGRPAAASPRPLAGPLVRLRAVRAGHGRAPCPRAALERRPAAPAGAAAPRGGPGRGGGRAGGVRPRGGGAGRPCQPGRRPLQPAGGTRGGPRHRPRVRRPGRGAVRHARRQGPRLGRGLAGRLDRRGGPARCRAARGDAGLARHLDGRPAAGRRHGGGRRGGAPPPAAPLAVRRRRAAARAGRGASGAAAPLGDRLAAADLAAGGLRRRPGRRAGALRGRRHRRRGGHRTGAPPRRPLSSFPPGHRGPAARPHALPRRPRRRSHRGPAGPFGRRHRDHHPRRTFRPGRLRTPSGGRRRCSRASRGAGGAPPPGLLGLERAVARRALPARGRRRRQPQRRQPQRRQPQRRQRHPAGPYGGAHRAPSR